MLYLDTEFNGFGGELISIALVSDTAYYGENREFYAIVPWQEPTHPWVEQHVVPFLGSQPAETYSVMRHRLRMFLIRHQDEPIIADWPDDFVHLLQALREDGGVSFEIELEMRLVNSGPTKPAIPHNALSDAWALMAWHKAAVA